MSRPELKIIEGGLPSREKTEKKFVSSYITDTRLMGAMAMYVCWDTPDCPETDSFHQFFYFDTEEYGFETYKSLWGYDKDEIYALEQSLISGLGGKKSDISEKEVRRILWEYADYNREHGLDMPGRKDEYAFLLENGCPRMTQEEEDILNAKMRTPLKSDYHVINYFLMRCLSGDLKGAGYLTKFSTDGDSGRKPAFDLSEPFCGIAPCTLCKNTTDFSESGSYICQALIQKEADYSLLIICIDVLDMKVTGCRLQSSMKISTAEAAMLLSRSEFITVYEVMAEPEDLEKHTWDIACSTMVTVHENGKLMMSFNTDNDHVNKRIFRLSEDVFGLYYITDFGQFLISSYSLKNIRQMEDRISSSPLGKMLMPTAKYEFKEPVLYEFIQSDYEDFEEFMEFLTIDDD